MEGGWLQGQPLTLRGDVDHGTHGPQGRMGPTPCCRALRSAKPPRYRALR
jgi:hypothetical protein